MKKIFIIVLLFCFIGIEVKAEDIIGDGSYYINDIIEYDLIDRDKFEVIERYNSRYDGNVEYVDSSKNIIILLIIFIIIGLIYLIIYDKNE